MSTPFVIVAFGDSITRASEVPAEARWPERLRAALSTWRPKREWVVINSGVGGNTSREGLARIETDVLAHRPDLVLVEFGGNDATDEPHRHVSLEEFATNLREIEARVASASGRAVLLTFTPVVNAWHSWGAKELFRGTGGPDEYVEQYRRFTRDYAAQRALPLGDIDLALRAAMKRDGAETHILKDGVHLTAAGNAVVAECVLEAIKPVLP